MKTNTRLIVRFALIVALVVTAFYIDSLISRIGLPIRMAVTTLIVVLTLVQLFDLKTAIFTTTAFGFTSLLFAYLIPNPASYLFVQPIISVFPRVFIGLVSYSILFVVTNALKNNSNEYVKNYLPRSIAAGAGVLTNTTLVLLMIAIRDNQDFFEKFLSTVIAFNFIPEIVAGVIVVPLIASAVKKGIKNFKI